MKKLTELDIIATEIMAVPSNTVPEKRVVSDSEIIQLIEPFPNINQKDCSSRTLIIYAAICNRQKLMEYLVKRGADLNIFDQTNKTALHYAVENNNAELVEYILQNGGKANAQRKYNKTPLMMCTYATDYSIFRHLLHYGANPYTVNHSGICAFDLFKDDPLIIEFFRNLTKDPDRPYTFKKTQY